MASFAIVSEGITDQVILEKIITTICEEHGDDDVMINPLQPLRDATDESRQGNFGGWEGVFEFCRRAQDLADALAFNNYLVIYIDTDMCEHPNYGMSLTVGGAPRSASDLIDAVIERLTHEITMDFYNENRERIIFAIAIHSLECWIIPFYADQNRAADLSRTLNCEEHLRRILGRKDIAYEKSHECYTVIGKCFDSHKTLSNRKGKSFSYLRFIDSLTQIAST